MSRTFLKLRLESEDRRMECVHGLEIGYCDDCGPRQPETVVKFDKPIVGSDGVVQTGWQASAAHRTSAVLNKRDLICCPMCGNRPCTCAAASDEQVIWFHGTSLQNADTIAKEGFKEGTWFSRHMEDAIEYGGPCVFWVKVKFDSAPMNWQVCSSNAIGPQAIQKRVDVWTSTEEAIQGVKDAAKRADAQAENQRLEPLLAKLIEAGDAMDKHGAWGDRHRWLAARQAFLEGLGGGKEQLAGKPECPTNISGGWGRSK